MAWALVQEWAKWAVWAAGNLKHGAGSFPRPVPLHSGKGEKNEGQENSCCRG